MQNEFVNDIKGMEDELLALKTSSEYTSVRSANYTSSATVYTGVYQITYENSDEDIFSIVICGQNAPNKGIVYPRTPSSNTQIIEVNTTYYDDGSSSYVTINSPVTIISNRAVIGVDRIN